MMQLHGAMDEAVRMKQPTTPQHQQLVKNLRTLRFSARLAPCDRFDAYASTDGGVIFPICIQQRLPVSQGKAAGAQDDFFSRRV